MINLKSRKDVHIPTGVPKRRVEPISAKRKLKKDVLGGNNT